jgi:hypothetical protein
MTGDVILTMAELERHLAASPFRPLIYCGPKPLFAPVPVRAMGDERLSAGHHRLLQAIAAHDRLGKNKRGCYASHDTLADETNLHFDNVSKYAGDLRRWGYIRVEKQEKDGRRRTYFVIYDEAEIHGEFAMESAENSTGSPSISESRR